MANSYLSEDGVTTIISLTKNELKKKASSVNGVAPDAKGNVTLYGDKVALSSTDDTTVTTKLKAVQSEAGAAKDTSYKIKTAITSGDTALYTSTDDSNPLNGTLTPLFATKAELNDALGSITGLKAEVVSALPATGVSGTMYLVAHAHGTGDAYDEYLWIESAKKFEKIGNTDIDLSSYAKKTDLNSYLTTANASSTYVAKTDLTEITSTKVTELWNSIS